MTRIRRPELGFEDCPTRSDVQPENTTSREFTAHASWPRLDRFLAELSVDLSAQLSRSQLHRLIVNGLVLINGTAGKPSQAVRRGDRISVTVPPPRPLGVVPQWMPLELVFQDGHIVVIDKPPGLSVHPGPGHPDRTLVNALLALCPDIQGIGERIRPGIVHRLDKDTSGLMVVAKTHQAHRALSDQIHDRQVTKGYTALAVGLISPSQGQIDAPISRDPRHRKRMAVVPGGRESRTSYQLLEEIQGHSLLELYLETGRTHQIRVHLAYLGHPLMGDAVYGKTSSVLSRHFLHAHHLGFRHPASGDPVEFRSTIPADLVGVLDSLRAERPV